MLPYCASRVIYYRRITPLDLAISPHFRSYRFYCRSISLAILPSMLPYRQYCYCNSISLLVDVVILCLSLDNVSGASLSLPIIPSNSYIKCKKRRDEGRLPQSHRSATSQPRVRKQACQLFHNMLICLFYLTLLTSSRHIRHSATEG